MYYFIFNSVVFIISLIIRIFLLSEIPFSLMSIFIISVFCLIVIFTLLRWVFKLVKNWKKDSPMQQIMIDNQKIPRKYFVIWGEILMGMAVGLIIIGWPIQENYKQVFSSFVITIICLSFYELFRSSLIFATQKIFSL